MVNRTERTDQGGEKGVEAGAGGERHPHRTRANGSSCFPQLVGYKLAIGRSAVKYRSLAGSRRARVNKLRIKRNVSRHWGQADGPGGFAAR